MLLPLIGVGLSVVLSLAIMDRHRRALERGSCPQCAYDLVGTLGGVCPECGLRLHATTVTGWTPLMAEIGVVLLSIPLQAGLLAGGFSLVQTWGLGSDVHQIANSAIATLVMIANSMLVAMAYSVRHVPRELSGIMIVYMVGAVDTGVAWFAAMAGA